MKNIKFDSDKLNEILTQYNIVLTSITDNGHTVDVGSFNSTEITLKGNIEDFIKLYEDIVEEHEARKNYPAVKKAYEEYLFIKRICSENN